DVKPNAKTSSWLPMPGAVLSSLKKLCPLALVQVPSVSPKIPWTKTTATLLWGSACCTQCGSVVFAAVLSLPQPAAITASPMTRTKPTKGHAARPLARARSGIRRRVSIDLLPRGNGLAFADILRPSDAGCNGCQRRLLAHRPNPFPWENKRPEGTFRHRNALRSQRVRMVHGPACPVVTWRGSARHPISLLSPAFPLSPTPANGIDRCTTPPFLIPPSPGINTGAT